MKISTADVNASLNLHADAYLVSCTAFKSLLSSLRSFNCNQSMACPI